MKTTGKGRLFVGLLTFGTLLWTVIRFGSVEEDPFAKKVMAETRVKNQCSNPRNTAVFHKTHKCSSTTIQNIMLRYALKHELDLALPSKGNYLGKIERFNTSTLGGTLWQTTGIKYDMFCLHNRWNGEEVAKIMKSEPNDRTPYFTILREPLSLYRSLWDYYDYTGKYQVSLEDYALSEKQDELADRVIHPHIGRNQMMWDFGLDPVNFDNQTAVNAKIREIDATFDLVMLTERFNESIVLLKKLLCWDYDDLASLKLNAHEESSKSSLSTKAQNALKRWLWADYQLYHHFRYKFNRLVESLGAEHMERELTQLQNANNDVSTKCVLKKVANRNLKPKQRLYGQNVVAYKLNKDIPQCQYYAMDEIKFLDKLRIAQANRIKGANE